MRTKLLRRAFALVLAGWLAGSSAMAQIAIGGGGVNSQTTISAIGRYSYGNIVTTFGDSTQQNGCSSNPAGTAYALSGTYTTGPQANCTLGWLTAFSGGGFQYVASMGYTGSYGSLGRVVVLTSGLCTPSTSLTFQPSAPTGGAPLNTAGTFIINTDANGFATVGTVINLATPGSGYVTGPTYTVSGGSCTTQPTLGYISTGWLGFGVPGDNTQGMIDRVTRDLCPAQPDIVINSFGVNDISQGVAEATITANIAQIVALEQACNIKVVLESIQARTNGVGGWTATMDKIRLMVNNYEQSLCARARLTSLTPNVVCVNSDKYWVDATNANGDALGDKTIDGLHPSVGGAEYRALVIWDAIKQWVGQSQSIPNSQNDAYDATNNPAGNLLGSTVGLFNGTGGTCTGTCSGTLAASWVVDSSGTGTIAAAASIESTRTDGKPGQRQVLAVTDTAGGVGDRVRLSTPLGTSNVTLGTDKIQAQIFLDLSNLSNVEWVGCDLLESNPTNNQIALGVATGSVTGYTINATMIPSATLAKIQEAKSLPDFGTTAAGSYTLQCTTPPITTQAASTGYTLYVYIVGAGTWSATVKASNARIWKAGQQ